MSFTRSKLGQLAFAAALVLSAATSAQAADFTFSYTFGDASFITGTLSGDLDGSFVDNISNIHVALNGVDFSGASLFAAGWNETTGNFETTTAARVSTDASLNNFIFTDSSGEPLGASTNTYFFRMNSASLGSTALASNLNNGGIALDQPISTGSWTLQQVAAVPGPSSYAMFLAGAALLTFVTSRRRRG